MIIYSSSEVAVSLLDLQSGRQIVTETLGLDNDVFASIRSSDVQHVHSKYFYQHVIRYEQSNHVNIE